MAKISRTERPLRFILFVTSSLMLNSHLVESTTGESYQQNRSSVICTLRQSGLCVGATNEVCGHGVSGFFLPHPVF